MIRIIVATENNNVIGNNGDLVIKDSEDMRMFKEFTSGSSVVMGRKTFESLPMFLKDRNVYVVSKSGIRKYYSKEEYIEVDYFSSFKEFVQSLDNNVWIIGGGEIYSLALQEEVVDEIYISRFNIYLDGDTYFPQIPKNFVKTLEESFKNYTLEIWTR